ncbi:MAG: CoA-binding protein [Terriglobia bacterium]
MREASLNDITKFLECKRIAFVGVSRNPKHFSRLLFHGFLDKGYDTVPVNPQAKDIDGRQCFARIADVTPPVEAALMVTGAPEVTNQAIHDCNQAEIRNIWIYKNMEYEADHEHAVEFCRLQGSAVIEGYCPMMFLPHPGFVHRAHRVLMKLVGSHPL